MVVIFWFLFCVMIDVEVNLFFVLLDDFFLVFDFVLVFVNNFLYFVFIVFVNLDFDVIWEVIMVLIIFSCLLNLVDLI